MKAVMILATVMILMAAVMTNFRPLRSPQMEQTLLRAAASDTEAAAILRATVRIRIVAPYLDGRGDRVMMRDSGRPVGLDAINRGLGTLVTDNGRTLIVTHDHYNVMNTAVAEATVIDYTGRETTLPIDTFRQLIRYHNNGVLVLEAPAGLPAGLPLGHGAAVQPGSTVRLVHRDAAAETLSVVDAVVEAWIDYRGVPSYTLGNVNGEVVAPGNSGGGVWAGGRLVGVIQRTILTADGTGDAPPAPSHRSYALRLAEVRLAALE